MGNDVSDSELQAQLRRRSSEAELSAADLLPPVRTVEPGGGRRPPLLAVVVVVTATVVLIGAVFVAGLGGRGPKPSHVPSPTSAANATPIATAMNSPSESPSDAPTTSARPLPSPEATASPTPAASYTPSAPARTIKCKGGDYGPDVVVDSTGLVDSCTAGDRGIAELDRGPVYNLPEDDHSLVIEWGAPYCVKGSTTTLAPASASTFSVVAASPDRTCANPAGLLVREVTLHTIEPIDPSQIVEVNGQPVPSPPPLPALRGSDTVTSGDFVLELVSPQTEFVADEPISGIRASVTYKGAQAQITVGTGYALIGPWSFDQLDGPIHQGGISPLPCGGTTLFRNQPVTADVQKGGGVSHDDPLAPWVMNWWKGPDFTLPPGTWRITVQSSFSPGGGCGSSVSLSASVVVKTVAPGQPTRSP